MKKRKIFSSVCGILAMALFLFPTISFGQEQLPAENSERPVTSQAINLISAKISSSTDGVLLEKIPTPDQIKNFKVIKNIDGALYGIRLQNMTNSQVKTQTQAKVKTSVDLEQRASSSSASLEKIPAPQFIKDYEKIQKIGNALWGVKKISNTQKTNRYYQVSSDMKDCVSKAINTKDDALKNYLTNNNDSLLDLISDRQACQLLALETLDGQGEKVAACNQEFQKKHQAITKAMKDSHVKIWNQYREDLKTCSPNSSSEGATLMIEDGGSVLLENAGLSL